MDSSQSSATRRTLQATSSNVFALDRGLDRQRQQLSAIATRADSSWSVGEGVAFGGFGFFSTAGADATKESSSAAAQTTQVNRNKCDFMWPPFAAGNSTPKSSRMFAHFHGAVELLPIAPEVKTQRRGGAEDAEGRHNRTMKPPT